MIQSDLWLRGKCLLYKSRPLRSHYSIESIKKGTGTLYLCRWHDWRVKPPPSSPWITSGGKGAQTVLNNWKLECNWGHRSIISRGLFLLQRYADVFKSCGSMMINLERKAERNGSNEIWKFNKLDPFPLLVCIRSSYHILRHGRWFGCLTFQYVSSLCL